jgi:hypothetical protein
MNSQNPRRRRPGRCGLRASGCLVWAAASLWFCWPAAWAADDHVAEDSPAIAQPNPQAFQVNLGQQFEHFVRRDLLGAVLGAGGRSPEDGANQSSVAETIAFLRSLGASRVASIDVVCGLSPTQRKRLRFAVDSELGNVIEELESAHAKYVGAVVEIDRHNPASQGPMREFQRDTQRLLQRRRSLLGGDSTLAKSLPTTLDDDQLARLTAETEARRDLRWRAIVALLLEDIDTCLGLDQRQYDAVERMLLEERPLLRVDVAVAPNAGHNQQTEQMLALLVLSEIDGRRLQATIGERQWKVLSQWREQGARVRSHVASMGILEQASQ